MKLTATPGIVFRSHGRGGMALLQKPRKHGFRFDRRADMDEMAAQEAQPRDELLREAVDLLPHWRPWSSRGSSSGPTSRP